MARVNAELKALIDGFPKLSKNLAGSRQWFDCFCYSKTRTASVLQKLGKWRTVSEELFLVLQKLGNSRSLYGYFQEKCWSNFSWVYWYRCTYQFYFPWSCLRSSAKFSCLRPTGIEKGQIWTKKFQKMPENMLFIRPLFSKFCLRRRTFGENRVFSVL